MRAQRYLLDTHLIYWWMTNDEKLGEATKKVIRKGDMAVSVVSLWEMILKNSKGKLPLPSLPLDEAMQDQGFVLVPLEARHLERLRHLKEMHDDSFDRLLVAIAAAEGRVLLTRDAVILSAGFAQVQAG